MSVECARKPVGVSVAVFVHRRSISRKQPYLCVPLRMGLRAWWGGRSVSARVVCVGTFASSGPVLSLWPVVYGCIDICESLYVSGSLPASCPSRALNATLLPECAEECGGQGERGAHVLGCRPAGCGKLLRPGGRGCGQAKPAWSQALQLLPSSDSSHPFLCQAGDLLRWVLHQVESTASLPPLPRWLDRPLPLPGPQHPWGKERGWDYRFFEVLPSPDILSIL